MGLFTMLIALVISAAAGVAASAAPALVQNPCDAADLGEARFSEAWVNAELLRKGHPLESVCRRGQSLPELAEEYAGLSEPELAAEQALLRDADKLSNEVRLESLRRMRQLLASDPAAAAQIGLDEAFIAGVESAAADDH